MNKTFTYLSEVFFDELDGLGVMHHTRYLIHLERAQQKFFQELLGVPDFNAERDEDIYVVVHGVTMRFTIRNTENTCVYCDGKRTVCKLSSETHQPSPWTEPFRAAMEARTSGE